MTTIVADTSTGRRSRGRNLDEADRLLVWIRSLVSELEGLEQAGAAETELERSRREIANLLWRLAAVVRHGELGGAPGLTHSS